MSPVTGSCLDPRVPVISVGEARRERHLSQAPVNRKILLRRVGDCSSSVHTKEGSIYNRSSHSRRWAHVNVHEEDKHALLRVTCGASGFMIAEARFVVHGTRWLCDTAARTAGGETGCQWRVSIRLVSSTRSVCKPRPRPDQKRKRDPSDTKMFLDPFKTI